LKILAITLGIILYFLKIKKQNYRDETNYDWSKFIITPIQNSKVKKTDPKEKTKIRVKDLSKPSGFIKEEHKFPIQNNSTSSQNNLYYSSSNSYLNYEEADNLQDMINFAASINQQKEQNKTIYPIESLYHQALSDKTLNANHHSKYTNERLDKNIAKCLKDDKISNEQKIDQILDLYAKLLRNKNKNLSASTYIGLIELFIKNGYLHHASYFLCQMDRLKMDIPRSLLDLFLDYSISNGLFEQKDNEEIHMINNQYELDVYNNNKNNNYNKYDNYEPPNEPEYAYYFSRKNNYKQRRDMKEVFTSLKLDSKPFYPKKREEQELTIMKQKLSEIDIKNIKEYIPKSKRVKEEEKQSN
jgi:hypothetical protein